MTRCETTLGSCVTVAEMLATDELARTSKAAMGDHPRGSSPGKPCPERDVSCMVVPSITVPAGIERATLPDLTVPPAEPTGTGAARGVTRASTGTVPTPSCTNTSRSTVVLPGLLTCTNTWESLYSSEQRTGPCI